MAIHAVSIEEAIAQGSSCRQMASIADFHELQLRRKMRIVEQASLNSHDRKSLRLRQELESELKVHRETIAHFISLATRMKARGVL